MLSRKLFLFCCSVAMFTSAGFCVGLDCSTLKTKIEDGLKAKGVQGYSLTVVVKSDSSTPGKVVGTCDGGAQKILYDRAAASKPASQPPAAPAAKPPAAK